MEAEKRPMAKAREEMDSQEEPVMEETARTSEESLEPDDFKKNMEGQVDYSETIEKVEDLFTDEW